MELFLTGWLSSLPAFAMPLLLAAVGLILSERAGVLNMGAEGYMAMGAMTGAVVTLTTGSPWIGVAAAILAGAALAGLFAIATVIFRADQILAGLATVALGGGITAVIGRPYLHKTFPGLLKLDPGAIGNLPLVGGLIFRQDLLAYLGLLLVLVLWWGLRATRTGLKLRAVGEDPATADVAGVDIQLYQAGAVLACGALCGLAGAYLSIVSSNVWVEGMVNGRGWIALALVIFARWSPARAILGAVIFGGADAALPRLLALGAQVPTYLLSTLPYLLTILVLVLAALGGRRGSAEPRSLGLAYIRQDRR